jgi:formylglycine-generating enzyme required for sulfatase activity
MDGGKPLVKRETAYLRALVFYTVVQLSLAATPLLAAGPVTPSLAATSAPKPAHLAMALQSFKEPVTGMEFVTLPKGCFQMGDTFGDGQGDEKPVHKTCLDSFSIGRYEVTNGQYRKFRPDHHSGSYEGNSLDNDDQPVAYVSWIDAIAFAQWLEQKSGRKFRLPSEAEWEYAARGGTDNRNFWGSDPKDACRYANGADLAARSQWPDWTITECNDGFKVSAPAGRFIPNAFGLYDMMGNAWEWTNDWYDAEYYFDAPRDNPSGPPGGALRIPRGGGWGNASECVRVSDRNGFAPDFRILFLGFRLASTP